MTPTKARIIETSAELFRRQGYSATGVKQIVTAAEAPFGSLYHFFPGGKEELGAVAVRSSGALYAELIPAVIDQAADLATGVRDFFATAVARLRETDYEEGCPIATVALEVSSTSEPMREACGGVFETWLDAASECFTRGGLDPVTARELAIAMLAALEGAFVLARALRDTEPLRIAGELTAERAERAERLEQVEQVERAPQAAPGAPQAPPSAARVRPRLRARWPDRGERQFPGPASP